LPKPIEPKIFWENKILNWEHGRYHNSVPDSDLESVANKASNSLRFRLSEGIRLLKPHVKNKRIIDLGCGSGLIAEEFLRHGAKSYLGIDIAENAVLKGNERLEAAGLAKKAKLICKSIEQLGELNGDIIFSLGLLDWLTNEEIARIFRNSADKIFLHSISEKRISLEQILHRIYVQISYGHKTGAYRPIYHSVAQIRALAKDNNIEEFFVHRDRRLSFGAFIMSFQPTH
jgi:SAM-dependent methyltransferase